MYCYVVKSPVFRLQRGSAKSPLAPSSQDLLGQAETIITTMLTFGKIWHFPKLTYFFNLNKISLSP